MKTTNKDFELFKQYAAEYISKLGLVEWSVHLYHGELDGVYALTNMNSSGMVATITLSKYWDDLREKSEAQIQRLALHEVLHLVMNPLLSEAKERYTTPYQLEGIEHSIIRRLENTIL